MKQEFKLKGESTMSYVRYEHYKGEVYEVMGRGVHIETKEKFVIYKGIFDSGCDFHLLPYDMFFGNVIVDGEEVPRFKRLETPTFYSVNYDPEQAHRYLKNFPPNQIGYGSCTYQQKPISIRLSHNTKPMKE